MIRYIHLRAKMEALENVELPAFAGSTLRGAFMAALKKSACMQGGDCGKECGWPGACAYGFLCETPVPADAPSRLKASKFAPHPYVLTPPEGGMRMAGDTLEFDVALWGKGRRHLRTVVEALETMASLGIGRGRGKLRLRRVVDFRSEQPVYINGNIDLERAERRESDWAEESKVDPRALRVDFATPVNLQKRGELVTEFDFGELVYGAADRLWVLYHCHGDGEQAPPKGDLASKARDAGVELVEHATRRVSIPRYSRRQQKHHRLEGVTGHLVFAGEIGPFMPLLEAAELFHVGKGTSFGLGALRLRGEIP